MEVAGPVTVCSNPREYVWWDEYHPTKTVRRQSDLAGVGITDASPLSLWQVHSLIASEALKALRAKGWAP